jgi:NIPSNAP
MKLWGLLTAMGLTLAGWISFAAALDKKTEARVFELRTYHSAPGKMKALHARFRDHTNKLFEKHGMTVIGFWNPIDPEKGEHHKASTRRQKGTVSLSHLLPAKKSLREPAGIRHPASVRHTSRAPLFAEPRSSEPCP